MLILIPIINTCVLIHCASNQDLMSKGTIKMQKDEVFKCITSAVSHHLLQYRSNHCSWLLNVFTFHGKCLPSLETHRQTIDTYIISSSWHVLLETWVLCNPRVKNTRHLDHETLAHSPWFNWLGPGSRRPGWPSWLGAPSVWKLIFEKFGTEFRGFLCPDCLCWMICARHFAIIMSNWSLVRGSLEASSASHTCASWSC